MAKIEPHRSWAALEARAEHEQNPRRRALLRQVRDHMEREITGQLEPLMATLTDHPVYHFWGAAPSALEGREAVRKFYNDMFARGGQQFEVVVERIVVDDDAVVTEGRVRQVHKGAALRALGMSELAGSPLADDDLVLTDAQLVTVWPADAEGRLIGEDIYFGDDPFRNAERLAPEELPGYFRL